MFRELVRRIRGRCYCGRPTDPAYKPWCDECGPTSPRSSDEGARNRILVALIPHKGHDGIPGAPEGVLCIRCNAERTLEALVREHAARKEALTEILSRHPRGCGVIHGNKPKGWTCLDEQQRAIEQPKQYSEPYGEEVRRGERLCDVCVARDALAAVPRERRNRQQQERRA